MFDGGNERLKKKKNYEVLAGLTAGIRNRRKRGHVYYMSLILHEDNTKKYIKGVLASSAG